jgi:hypothetical protein
MPYTKNLPIQTSVCCSSDYTDEELWVIAETHLNLSRERTPGKRTLYGRADVQAGAIIRYLELDRDDQLFIGHANILGWPSDEGQQRELALLIAQASHYEPVKS